jgi:hypothetical protein
MKTIKITRKHDSILTMVPATIIINDTSKGKLKSGQTQEISVADGSYELQIKTVYGIKTEKFPIKLAESGLSEIEITRDSRYMKIYCTRTLPIAMIGFTASSLLLDTVPAVGGLLLVATLVGAIIFTVKANKVMFEVKQVK